MIDLLTWQGHGPHVMTYTLRQLNLLARAANQRLKRLYQDPRQPR